MTMPPRRDGPKSTPPGPRQPNQPAPPNEDLPSPGPARPIRTPDADVPAPQDKPTLRSGSLETEAIGGTARPPPNSHPAGPDERPGPVVGRTSARQASPGFQWRVLLISLPLAFAILGLIWLLFAAGPDTPVQP